MILVVLFFLILCGLRMVGEVAYEHKFPVRTLPAFLVVIGIAFYALTNL
jgi:hypothetical protein